jgi:cell division transport system permease protein
MEQTAKQLEQFPEVEDVRFGGDWVKRLDALGRAIERGALVVGSLVALVIVFVLYTTIRLTVVARRPQLEIMSRLGATDRFVATPFIVEALLQAGIAAALALGVMFAVQQAFVARIVPIAFLPWSWIGMFLGAAMLLGWIASLLALSRVLRSVGA